MPSAQAWSSAPADYHHALTGFTVLSNLETRGITMVGKLVRPTITGRKVARLVHSPPVEYTPSKDENTDPYRFLPWEAPPVERAARERLLSVLLLTDWHPQLDHRANNRPQGKISAWQNQTNIKDCLRVHTNYRSNLVPWYGSAGPRNSYCPVLPFLQSPDQSIAHSPLTDCVVHVYTDRSAVNNDSPAECTSTTAWVSDTGTSDHQRITGLPLSNNTAEIVAIAMALQAWQLTNLHIHTDSKVALKLLEGGLLEQERNGWIDTPWVAFPPTDRPHPCTTY